MKNSKKNSLFRCDTSSKKVPVEGRSPIMYWDNLVTVIPPEPKYSYNILTLTLN